MFFELRFQFYLPLLQIMVMITWQKKINYNWTSFKNFAPKLNLNQSTYIISNTKVAFTFELNTNFI